MYFSGIVSQFAGDHKVGDKHSYMVEFFGVKIDGPFDGSRCRTDITGRGASVWPYCGSICLCIVSPFHLELAAPGAIFGRRRAMGS